ncbi:hypothetical protein ACQP2F_26100 [Actinoplanes sp. CA-030573]|uniref:hypothetical protein n=1 Tax=Actinoplanes sp. CA-030573 TaxID=3239898 RepID=UPI003D8C9E1F
MAEDQSQPMQEDDDSDTGQESAVTADNVAGRLYAIVRSLGTARRSDGRPAAMPTVATGEQMCRLLGADPDDVDELRSFGLRYLAMIAQIRAAVARLPERKKKEPLLRHLPEFEDLFISLFLRTKPLQYASVPGENAMYGLEMCADALEEHQIGGASVPKAKVDEILRLTQDLMAAVRNDDDLTPDLKMQLIDLLLDIERAILHVRIVGVEGVQATVDRLVGASIAFPEAQKPSFTDRLGRLWRTVHNVSVGAKEIADAGASIVAITDALNS